MKKTVEKIFVVIIMIIMCYIYLGLENKVYAVGIGVSSSSIDIGGTTTISVSIPDGYVAYEGSISFDSSKLSYISSSSGNLVGGIIKVADANTSLNQVSNFSVTFKGNSAGSANVSVNLTLCNSDGNATSAGGSGIITIKDPAPAPAPEPEPTPEPVQTPEPVAQVPENNNSTPQSNNSTPAPEQSAPPAPKEPNFKQTNDTVYATKSMNVRSSWSTDSSKIGGLVLGQSVTRTGIGDNGWSRILYDGKTAYVSTSLITTTKPEEPEEEQEEDPENQEEIEEQPDEENTENVELEEDEKAVYDEIVNKIGTIPEVGNNVNFSIYFCVIGISIISMILIFRKEA